MVYKRKILIFCLLLILSVVMAEEIVGNPQIELIDVSEGKCINIELSITNDSDDIKKYFSIPFWVKNIYISYDGPLGTSNQVQLPIR